MSAGSQISVFAGKFANSPTANKREAACYLNSNACTSKSNADPVLIAFPRSSVQHTTQIHDPSSGMPANSSLPSNVDSYKSSKSPDIALFLGVFRSAFLLSDLLALILSKGCLVLLLLLGTLPPTFQEVARVLRRGFAKDGTLKAFPCLARLGVGPLLDSPDEVLEENDAPG